MQINLTKLDEKAVMPQKAHENDAGFDLTAIEKYNDEFGNIVYDTKISLEIPVGYFGLVAPRSSVSKKALSLANSIGIIDSDYRGPIICKFKPTAYYTQREESEKFEYELGDRIAQLLILPVLDIQFTETKELSKSERGTKGFGSSGN
jgi:dUTP pyrophosphatase